MIDTHVFTALLSRDKIGAESNSQLHSLRQAWVTLTLLKIEINNNHWRKVE